MLYKFRSKAGGDIVMLGANGDEVLRAMGREPAAQGIIEAADMAAALQRVEAALSAGAGGAGGAGRAGSARDESAVSLRQRLWPMVELMKRAQAAGEPIVCGA